MESMVIKVNGMMCNGCENRIQNALGSMEEVKDVIADHKEGTVKISLKSNIDRKVLEEKIEDIGFEVVKED